MLQETTKSTNGPSAIEQLRGIQSHFSDAAESLRYDKEYDAAKQVEHSLQVTGFLLHAVNEKAVLDDKQTRFVRQAIQGVTAELMKAGLTDAVYIAIRTIPIAIYINGCSSEQS